MILFLLLALVLALLVALALVFGTRQTGGAATVREQAREQVREQVNVAIYRERLAELDAERDAGRFGDEQHAALVGELQRMLVDDVAPGTVTATATGNAGVSSAGGRRIVLSLVVLVPLLSLAIYLADGFDAQVRDWLDLSSRTTEASALLQPHSDGVAVSGDLSLPDAARLTQSLLGRRPEDAEAWYRLGMVWADLDAPEQALECLRTAGRLAPGNIEILVTLADAELTLADGRLTDSVRAVLDAVLSLDPAHQGILMAYGMAAFTSGDYATTVRQWRRLQSLLDPASEGVSLLERSIVVAEQRAATAVHGAVPVRVVPALATGEFPMEAALFVIVRPAGGAGAPVAVRRLPPVLPVEITLTDADQMIRGEPFARRGALEVLARLSMSGTPTAAAGDLESAPLPLVFPLKAPAVLALDKRLP